MKKSFINKRWIFLEAVFSLLILFGAMGFREAGDGASIVMIVLGGILILGYAFLMPIGYTLSSKGITVRYCFIKASLSWKDVKHIEEKYAGGKCFPWWSEYEIGYFKTKFPFYETAAIPKNKKTTKMITQYYHRPINKN